MIVLGPADAAGEVLVIGEVGDPVLIIAAGSAPTSAMVSVMMRAPEYPPAPNRSIGTPAASATVLNSSIAGLRGSSAGIWSKTATLGWGTRTLGAASPNSGIRDGGVLQQDEARHVQGVETDCRRHHRCPTCDDVHGFGAGVLEVANWVVLSAAVG